MEKLTFILSVCSFLCGLFFVAATLTGKPLTKIVLRLLGIIAVVTPILYWFKLLNII